MNALAALLPVVIGACLALLIVIQECRLSRRTP